MAMLKFSRFNLTASMSDFAAFTQQCRKRPETLLDSTNNVTNIDNTKM